MTRRSSSRTTMQARLAANVGSDARTVARTGPLSGRSAAGRRLPRRGAGRAGRAGARRHPAPGCDGARRSSCSPRSWPFAGAARSAAALVVMPLFRGLRDARPGLHRQDDQPVLRDGARALRRRAPPRGPDRAGADALRLRVHGALDRAQRRRPRGRELRPVDCGPGRRPSAARPRAAQPGAAQPHAARDGRCGSRASAPNAPRWQPTTSAPASRASCTTSSLTR